jgi:hypothetical protein
MLSAIAMSISGVCHFFSTKPARPLEKPIEVLLVLRGTGDSVARYSNAPTVVIIIAKRPQESHDLLVSPL